MSASVMFLTRILSEILLGYRLLLINAFGHCYHTLLRWSLQKSYVFEANTSNFIKELISARSNRLGFELTPASSSAYKTTQLELGHEIFQNIYLFWFSKFIFITVGTKHTFSVSVYVMLIYLNVFWNVAASHKEWRCHIFECYVCIF